MTADEIRAHIDPMRHEFAESRSLVLPALKFAQTEKGHLDRDDLAAVADAVGLTSAYVESVASFYDRLYLKPTGKHLYNAGDLAQPNDFAFGNISYMRFAQKGQHVMLTQA